MRSAAVSLATVAMLVIACLASAARAQGDPGAGKIVFNKCAVCHPTDSSKKGLGPTLFGVVGRHCATVAGFNYSAPMKAADKTWDEATLDAYLTDPQAMVRGSKMVFPACPNPRTAPTSSPI
jgi:cytochrome c